VKVRNPDATRKEMQDTKTQWQAAFRDRTVAVTNQGTEPFQPIAWKPEEAQMLESRQFDIHTWALIFGMPLRLLGVEQTSRTYQNVEHENSELLTFTMGGHLGRFEQTLSLHRPEGEWAKANLDSILRSDTNARYEAHKTALDAGFLTVEEVRDIEDRPPLEQSNKTMSVQELARTLQQIYLSVGIVITAEEARDMLNRAGASLSQVTPNLPGRPTASAAQREGGDDE
jgi:HK97 family phage portal protein